MLTDILSKRVHESVVPGYEMNGSACETLTFPCLCLPVPELHSYLCLPVPPQNNNCVREEERKRVEVKYNF